MSFPEWVSIGGCLVLPLKIKLVCSAAALYVTEYPIPDHQTPGRSKETGNKANLIVVSESLYVRRFTVEVAVVKYLNTKENSYAEEKYSF